MKYDVSLTEKQIEILQKALIDFNLSLRSKAMSESDQKEADRLFDLFFCDIFSSQS